MTQSSPPPPETRTPRARVVLLTGPSGSGKSHLASRLGAPTVCLDDLYRDGDDPHLPVGPLGIADWDDPSSWHEQEAFEILRSLATAGTAEIPVYDIALDRRVGSRRLTLGPSERIVVAEGIFAAQLIARCAAAGILADAICLVHHPTVTFWRRLVRDLREGRKAPWTLVRRGLALRAGERDLVAEHERLGAEPLHPAAAAARLRDLLAATSAEGDDAVDRAHIRQDGRITPGAGPIH